MEFAHPYCPFAKDGRCGHEDNAAPERCDNQCDIGIQALRDRLAKLERVADKARVLRGASTRVGEENYTVSEANLYNEHYRNPWEDLDVALSALEE